jgi:EAL domain-containing protein (putative c-di-GMP-specific phosphodiesterase class I)
MREGCDESQGYLHARPLPKSEIEAWLHQNNAQTQRGKRSSRSSPA